MKNNSNHIKLTSYDDIFKDDETRQIDSLERVKMIPIEELDDFSNHPFKIIDDDKMQETVASIKENGVLVPAIVRPKQDGRYEIISGHRRRYACAVAGIAEMPAIVRDLTDDEATIIMVDSNLQRESLLPSEKAFAYKMKLEAMKRQGKRTDLTSSQIGTKLRSDELLSQQVGESRNQIARYIRLTELMPEILDMVDDKVISLNAGVEVSYLKNEEQQQLFEIMECDECIPSISQAQRLKKCSLENRLTKEVIIEIMSEEKDIEMKVTLGGSKIKKYFPKEYTPKQMETVILKLLDSWSKKQRQQNELEK